MKALIKNDQCVEIVTSTKGHSLVGVTVVDAPENPEDWVWNGEWKPRPPTLAEQDEATLTTDSRWSALKQATPEQVEAWLTNNVNSVADVRRVLKVLLLEARRKK